MSQSPLQWFRDLDPLWKSLAVIAASFGVGVVCAVAFLNYWALPDQVQAHEARIEQLEKTHQRWKPLIEDVPTMMETMTNLEREVRLSNCLTLADRRGYSWRECLAPPFDVSTSESSDG